MIPLVSVRKEVWQQSRTPSSQFFLDKRLYCELMLTIVSFPDGNKPKLRIFTHMHVVTARAGLAFGKCPRRGGRVHSAHTIRDVPLSWRRGRFLGDPKRFLAVGPNFRLITLGLK